MFQIIIGLGLIIIGFYGSQGAHHIKQAGIHTQGQVTAVSKAVCNSSGRWTSRRYDCYSPTITYTDNQNRKASFVALSGNYKTGQTVDVVYLPGKGNAQIDNSIDADNAWIAGAFGVGLVLNGIWVARKRKKDRANFGRRL